MHVKLWGPQWLIYHSHPQESGLLGQISPHLWRISFVFYLSIFNFFTIHLTSSGGLVFTVTLLESQIQPPMSHSRMRDCPLNSALIFCDVSAFYPASPVYEVIKIYPHAGTVIMKVELSGVHVCMRKDVTAAYGFPI